MPISRLKSIAMLSAAGAAVATACVQAQDAAPQTLQQCLASATGAAGFSGTVSVAAPSGTAVYTGGQMAGPGSPAMISDAQFNIGSAGKMWTAVAVAQLVEAGKVSLDDPIGRTVSGLTPELAAVTVRQLLTHSGGAGNFFVPENQEIVDRARSLGELKVLLTGVKPAFAPGSRSDYSNSGFLLLGLMIEAVSGQSYADYLAERIFKPAGMTGSGVLPADRKRRAVGMTNIPELDNDAGPPPPGARRGPPPPGGPGGPMLPPPGPLRVSPAAELMGTSAGGSFSTAADMQRFFAALMEGKLINPALRDTFTSGQIELLPAKGPLPAVFYGLGFAVSAPGGTPSYGHNGGLPGGNVATRAYPKERMVVVVMVNRDPPMADEVLRRLEPKLLSGACGT